MTTTKRRPRRREAAPQPAPRRRSAPAHSGGRSGNRSRTASGIPARPPRRRPVDHRRRIIGLFALFLIIGILFLLALVDLQTVQSDRLQAWGEGQRTRVQALPGYRGAVLDRDGFVLASSTRELELVADPQLVADPDATAALIAPVLGVAPADVRDELVPDDEDDRYGLLAESLGDRAVTRLAELLDAEDHDEATAGLALRPVEARVYPADALARPIVGRVDPDENGTFGIEWQLDEYLQGHAGEERFERGVFGRITGGEWSYEPPSPGADVVLTIDHRIQYVVEEALAEHCREMGARGANAVVSDPRTGEILAMGTVRRQSDGSCAVPNYNAALVDTFEPGSVLKAVTFSAAVNELGYTGATTIPVPPSVEIGDKVFEDHPVHPPADFPLSQIMSDSMNVGTIKLSQQVGAERLHDYLVAFGFGQDSGIGFKDEAVGTVKEEWHGSEQGSIPIGQGITVNSLQLISAYNTIANDGVRVAPKLIRSIEASDGSAYGIPPQEARQVMSERAADEVTSMLVGVVESGTGTAAAVDGYTVAGKTGTAWKVFSSGPYEGTYGVDGARNYVVTFAGFLPAEDPELSIIVVVDEPTVETTAGRVAAPVFADIAHYVLRIVRIPPATIGADDRGLVRGVPAGLDGVAEAAVATGSIDGASEAEDEAQP